MGATCFAAVSMYFQVNPACVKSLWWWFSHHRPKKAAASPRKRATPWAWELQQWAGGTALMGWSVRGQGEGTWTLTVSTHIIDSSVMERWQGASNSALLPLAVCMRCAVLTVIHTAAICHHPGTSTTAAFRFLSLWYSFYPSILKVLYSQKAAWLIWHRKVDREKKKKDPPHHSKKHCFEGFSKHFPFIYLYLQNSYPELPGVPVDPPCFLSQSYPSYSSASPQQQVSVLLQALRSALEDMVFMTQVISNICIYDVVCTLDYNTCNGVYLISGQVMIFFSVFKRSLLDCILTTTSPAPQNILCPASHTRTAPHSPSFLSPFTHTGSSEAKSYVYLYHLLIFNTACAITNRVAF